MIQVILPENLKPFLLHCFILDFSVAVDKSDVTLILDPLYVIPSFLYDDTGNLYFWNVNMMSLDVFISYPLC